MHQYVFSFPRGFHCELNLGLSALYYLYSHSIGQTQSHGPDLTLRSLGNVVFLCVQENGLKRSCQTCIIVSDIPIFHVNFRMHLPPLHICMWSHSNNVVKAWSELWGRDAEKSELDWHFRDACFSFWSNAHLKQDSNLCSKNTEHQMKSFNQGTHESRFNYIPLDRLWYRQVWMGAGQFTPHSEPIQDWCWWPGCEWAEMCLRGI